MPSEHDADVIRQQADELYSQADRTAMVGMVLAGLFGLLVGAASFYFLSERGEALSIVLALGFPLASAAIGGTVGEGHALKLRSQAQQLLISLAIERNTRKDAPHSA